MFAVCRERGGGGVFSVVVCKMKDVPQTQQMKPPASIQTLHCFMKTLKTLTIFSHFDLHVLTLGQYS